MDIVIVPNILSDKINAKLDKAFEDCPEAAVDREIFYKQLLEYFYDHGVIPDFELGVG